MTLKELIKRRVVLLSGKGGVGKTTVSVALGLAVARLRKKVLIVEMNSTERVAPFFGLTEVGQKEIPLAPYVTGINLNPKSCFEEYVLKQVKFKSVFETLFNNRFVTSFLNAVPGLNELLMIGKIFDLENQTVSRLNRDPLYDLIIVDSPATGHGVSTFEVPRIVTEAVRVGPLKTQAERIQKVLMDEEKTAFCVVTLAEEMPVTEATELAQTVKKRLKIPFGCFFLNALNATDFTKKEHDLIVKGKPDEDDPLYPYYAYADLDWERARLNAEHREALIEANKGDDIIELSFRHEDITVAEGLKALVEELA